MNKLYNRGRAFEYEVKKELERAGYFVIRSAGSHSPIDLVAISLGELWLIQCKTNAIISKEEENKLLELKKKLNAQIVMAYKQEGSIRYKWIPDMKEIPKPKRTLQESLPAS